MTVILRAFLVVGILTYFAAQKRDDGPSAARRDGARIEPSQLAAAWNGLPGDVRERILRDGAMEAARRLSAEKKPSQDTLASSDRRPAWRGAIE